MANDLTKNHLQAAGEWSGFDIRRLPLSSPIFILKMWMWMK